jgi:hypothetical protein
MNPQLAATAARSQGRRDVRPLLCLLAAADAATGGFATIAPHAFYRHVVGVNLLGPYSQHLLTDVGGFYLGFALLFAWAAWTLSPELVRAACAAAILTSLLHFSYHAVHLEHFSTGKAIAQTIGLTFQVALPLFALLANRPARPSTVSQSGPAS